MSFFSEAEHKFELVREGEEIPAKNFLLACNQILLFMDTLGPIIFKSPRADVSGYIQRILKKHRSDPEKFWSIQSIVSAEIAGGCNRGRKSCTMNLLWLKRTLEFVHAFSEPFLSGEESMVACGHFAYEQSFKPYHNTVLRKLFQIIMKVMMSRKEVMKALKKDPSLSDEDLMEHMKATMTAMKTNIDEINRFYTLKGQHCSPTKPQPLENPENSDDDS